jgi:HSP90 family molecular chaperone
VTWSANSIGGPSASQQPDNGWLSPFARVMSALQQLQRSDPTKYQQVTQQIAANLQSAAQTAQSHGDTTAANQLTQLANDFTSASNSNQLPNIQDLAQAIGGHHHHHHHFHAAPADSSGDSSSTASQLNQLLTVLQTAATQNNTQDPLSIILSTLSGAGISTSNG